MFLSPDQSPEAIAVFSVTPDSLEALLAKLGPLAEHWVDANGYGAKPLSVLVLPSDQGAVSAVLFGAPSAEQRLGAGALAKKLPAGSYFLSDGFEDKGRDSLAFALGSYNFDFYKKVDSTMGPKLAVDPALDVEELSSVIDGVGIARDLINTPAIDMGPADLAEQAETLFSTHGGTCNITCGSELLRDNFPLIHAVGAASHREPRLIDLAWGDTSHPKVTLVGKGVCFDTGGLNLKPGNSMALMKKDMGGAANVLGLASMIMAQQLPVCLRVLIPAVENAVSGPAFRPGDILTSRTGLTIEIGNTDAEGRLVLADALALADEEAPDLLIDMATLTGAARVALGPELPPFYTDDEDFAAQLGDCAAATQDPLWRLPLWKPYLKLMDSGVAETNNISGGPFAGSITAALFLSRFVENAKTWAHLDIYGWNPTAKPHCPVGGEAQGIRALYQLIKERFAS
ncbi:MAG: leucyl aminopeptidase family protein [Stappiaceae bacterium]